MTKTSRNKNFDRRCFFQSGAIVLVCGFILQPKISWAKTYMTADEAQRLIWGDMRFSPKPIVLTKAQKNAIKKTSKTRVRNSKVNAFQAPTGEWFILDQVIGKHEFIDIAVGIDAQGRVKGIEVLEYRESYGHEIINPKWRAQFRGKDASEVLKLDKQIKNISGATLSCRHIADGINRLTHTWDQVLRNA